MISILVPSRGRPHNLARLVYSLAETTAGDWEALVRIDQDDPERVAYRQVAAVDARVVVHEGPRGVLSGYWNELAGSAAGEILMMGADDLVFRTPKWDGIICDAFPPDRLALVHGDDLGDRGKTFATHGFVHRRWVEVTGQFVPPIFVADYADRWLNDVANIIDRREFRAVTIEHLHPGFGKAPLDRTYRETSDRARASDMALLYARTSRDRLRAAGRLLDAIEGR
ncbi:MAG: glycosyltransferase family A protein [Thermoleophilaceae bacterium]